MEAPHLERKLVAILAADIEGFSTHMERDEGPAPSRFYLVIGSSSTHPLRSLAAEAGAPKPRAVRNAAAMAGGEQGAQAAETVRNDLPRGDELDLCAKEMRAVASTESVRPQNLQTVGLI